MTCVEIKFHEPAFILGQCINILQLSTKGRVLALYFSDTGWQYNVRYIYNGEAKTVYFYGDELEAL